MEYEKTKKEDIKKLIETYNMKTVVPTRIPTIPETDIPQKPSRQNMDPFSFKSPETDWVDLNPLSLRNINGIVLPLRRMSFRCTLVE